MKQRRILVVDDDSHALAAVARVLKRSQYEVELANSGKRGLRAAVAKSPDLVLLDVSMPTMSGHEFLRRFRRLETHGLLGQKAVAKAGLTWRIPVIFLSGLSATRQCVSGLDAGAVDYIVKPYEADDLRARIRRQLYLSQEQYERELVYRLERLHLITAIQSLRQGLSIYSQSLTELSTYIELLDQKRNINDSDALPTKIGARLALWQSSLTTVIEATSGWEVG